MATKKSVAGVVEKIENGKRYFRITLELLEDYLGTISANKEIYTTYMYKKQIDAGHVSEETVKEESDEIEFPVNSEAGLTIISKDSKGLFIYSQIITGFLKDKAVNLSKISDIKQGKNKIQKWALVATRKIYFHDSTGEIITTPNGINERPIRGMTPAGPITSLIASEYISPGAQLTFELVLIENGEITPEYLYEILKMGSVHGLGQYRNGGYGKFKIVNFEEIKAEDCELNKIEQAPIKLLK